MEDVYRKETNIDRQKLLRRLREGLARIEHEQWMHWAKNILETEDISEERKERWKKFFVEYKELPEEIKEFDRVWADKVIDFLLEVYKSVVR